MWRVVVLAGLGEMIGPILTGSTLFLSGWRHLFEFMNLPQVVIPSVSPPTALRKTTNPYGVP